MCYTLARPTNVRFTIIIPSRGTAKIRVGLSYKADKRTILLKSNHHLHRKSTTNLRVTRRKPSLILGRRYAESHGAGIRSGVFPTEIQLPSFYFSSVHGKHLGPIICIFDNGGVLGVPVSITMFWGYLSSFLFWLATGEFHRCVGFWFPTCMTMCSTAAVFFRILITLFSPCAIDDEVNWRYYYHTFGERKGSGGGRDEKKNP